MEAKTEAEWKEIRAATLHLLEMAKVSVLAHETPHVLRDHPHQMRGRDPSRWNIAADLEINDDLAADGWEMPEQGPHRGVYASDCSFPPHLTANWYYDNLPESPTWAEPAPPPKQPAPSRKPSPTANINAPPPPNRCPKKLRAFSSPTRPPPALPPNIPKKSTLNKGVVFPRPNPLGRPGGVRKVGRLARLLGSSCRTRLCPAGCRRPAGSRGLPGRRP